MFKLRVELHACKWLKLATASQVEYPWTRRHTKDRLRLVSNAGVLGILGTGHDSETLRQRNELVEMAHECCSS